MNGAVYARQSVEKKNSLSIDGQIDLCRRAAGRELAVYQDKGFSGKNTRRPAFQRLMRDVKEDRIDRLYVYRLDRFSRSVADFGRLWEVLREHRVEFISVSESFDTSTPMGRAMLHIIMVFAQLERETTAERVRDNYYKRASLGAWPGGPAPYGYTIGRRPAGDGRIIPTLIVEPEHAGIVRRIFESYAAPGESLGSVARMLNGEGIPGPKRSTWDSVSLSRLLHCPAYVMADEQVRLHFQGSGVSITSSPADFDGQHGLLLVGKRNKAGKRYTDAREQSLSVLNSEGFIPPELWLACQGKLARNWQLGGTGKGTHTWLSGLLKCAACGYSLKVTQTASGRYLHCSGRYNLAKCTARIHIDLSVLEDEIAEQIQAMLDEAPDVREMTAPTAEYAERMAELDRKADRLLAAFTESSDLTSTYLHRALRQIEAERNKLLAEMPHKPMRRSTNRDVNFSRLDFEWKKQAASRFIRRIHVSEEDADVYWTV